MRSLWAWLRANTAVSDYDIGQTGTCTSRRRIEQTAKLTETDTERHGPDVRYFSGIYGALSIIGPSIMRLDTGLSDLGSCRTARFISPGLGREGTRSVLWATAQRRPSLRETVRSEGEEDDDDDDGCHLPPVQFLSPSPNATASGQMERERGLPVPDVGSCNSVTI